MHGPCLLNTTPSQTQSRLPSALLDTLLNCVRVNHCVAARGEHCFNKAEVKGRFPLGLLYAENKYILMVQSSTLNESPYQMAYVRGQLHSQHLNAVS